MEYTEQMMADNERAVWERCRKIQSVRFAVASNRTWDHDHPDQIRKQIASLQSILMEATL